MLISCSIRNVIIGNVFYWNVFSITEVLTNEEHLGVHVLKFKQEIPYLLKLFLASHCHFFFFFASRDQCGQGCHLINLCENVSLSCFLSSYAGQFTSQ